MCVCRLQAATTATMAMPRRRLKLAVMVMMVNLFIFLLVSRQGGQDKNSRSKVLLPSKPFWSRLVPPAAYWNRQQQILDLRNNPVMAPANSSGGALYWLNLTSAVEEEEAGNSCQPDLRVTSEVKDYSLLPQHFHDFLLYMRCRSYGVAVEPPATFCRRPPFLLLAVKSLAPHFDRRQAIRQTWGQAGRVLNRTVATIFLLGRAAAEDHFPDLQEMLRFESSKHGDLLQWEHRDSFFNLTVKEVLFLDWLQARCPGAFFIFKGDDDVFVNTHRILDFLGGLEEQQARDLFIGDVITNARPHRDKKVKYFIPESLYTGTYPPYAGGGGYLYSGHLAARLRNASRQVALYPIDDVYTGMCLRKLGLAPEKHKGFRTFDIEEKMRSNPCAYHKLMLVHPRTPQQMIQIWAWLSNPELSCQ